MRFVRLELHDVRGVDHCTVDFAESGVTLVTGRNEAGKSTLLEAIDLLFDVPADSGRKVVLDIQPKGRDVGPEVALEFTVGRNRLYYRKRWRTHPLTELKVVPPEGKPDLTAGREAHERARQLLEEHVDLALWRAVRLAQGGALDLPAFGAVRSLSTALDAIAGGSGPVDDTLLDRAEAERARYWSKQRGQPANELSAARLAAEEAQSRLAEAKAAYDATLDASRRIEDKEDELAALGSRLTGLERAAAEAAEKLADRDRVEQLKHQADQLRQIAESELERATAAAEERRRLRERFGRLDDELAAAAEEATEAERGATRAEEAREAAEEARNAAGAELRRQQERRQLLERELRSLELEAEIAGLESRVGRAEEAETGRHEAEAELRTLRVDERTLEEIRKAQAATDLARGRHEAASPRIRFEAAQRLDVAVDGEVLAVEPGTPWERVATATITLGIPGVGRISVSPGATGTRSELERAEAALRAALEAAGVESLSDAAAVAARRRHLEERLRMAEERLAGALDGVSDLETLQSRLRRARAELETLRVVRPNDLIGAATWETLRAELEEVARELERAGHAVEAAEDRLNRAGDDAKAAASRYATCLGRLRSQESERAAAERELAAERERVSDEDLEAARVAAAARLAEANAGVEDAARHLDTTDPLARERATQAAAAVEEARRRRIGLESELESDRRYLADRLGGGGADLLAEREREAEIARNRRDRVERQAEAARLLADTLRRERTEAQRRYRQPLEERLRAWGRTVFGEPLDAIELDEELRIAEVSRRGTPLPLTHLSAGTREQLGLLLRLAAATLAAPEEGVPVVLDDALGYSDESRRRGVLTVLRQAARQLQVVILSADAERFGGLGAKVIDLDRRPRAPHPDVGRHAPEAVSRSPDASVAGAPDLEVRGPTRDDALRRRDPGAPPSGGVAPRHPDEVAERILACLRDAEAPLGRSEICTRGQIDERAWRVAIRTLVSQGKVVQQGERRGARYRLL